MRKTNKISFQSRLSGIFLPALMMLGSCEKELDFKYNDIEPVTVIEGVLSPAGANVEITLTTPMNEPLKTAHLSDVEVTITDLFSGFRYTLFPDDSGYYTSDIGGIPGHEYLLEAVSDKFCCKSRTTMYGSVEMDSLQLNWLRMPYDDVAVLKGSFNEDPAVKGEYFWMRLYRNGEIYLWQTLDDRGAVDGKISFITMTSRKNTDKEDDSKILLEGDILTCTVCQISGDMHLYLEALENKSNGKPQFEGDFCLGFFMASTPATQSIVFHPEKIPYYK